MQQVSLIGTVAGTPEEVLAEGRRTLEFRLRAENSPKDRERSSYEFRVVTARMSLRGSLSPGTEVYVSGLLSLGEGTEATVQALVTHVIGRGSRRAEEAAMELLSAGIPLQGI